MAVASSFFRQRLEFPFPAAEPHSGVPLSNGTFGALLWGEGRRLRITLSRADYWDHRGGTPQPEPGTPPHPTRLPMGRLDLLLPPDWNTASGGLHLLTAEAELELQGYREQGKLRATLLRETPVLCFRITGVPGADIKLENRPPDAPEVVEWFRRYGLPKAEVFDLGEFGGWVQECPGEPALCVGWLRHVSAGGLLLFVTAEYGATPSEARRQALQTLETVSAEGYTPATLRSFSAWRKWWEKAPVVDLPDPTLQQLYHQGMYRLAGLSVPGGPVATRQGPWVEEDRLPLEGGALHFPQPLHASYWPCFGGNHLEALAPLEEALRAWEPRLREYARVSAGVPDGLLLPRMTDDHGQALGRCWAELWDPGALGWIAQLLWLRYRCTLDREYLRETVYPVLRGALRVHEVLLEEDGRYLALPATVSPDSDGATPPAWGRNASAQLAAAHFLCRALLQASTELGVDAEARPRWEELAARLPLGAVGPGPELLLGEGQPLTESHRDHSHLAALFPFDLLECDHSDADRTLIRNSLRRLTRMGTGQWCGLSFPWAAILHARQGNGDAAVLLLETFHRAFLTSGYASTHEARVPGISVLDSGPEVLEVTAATAACAAVLELLLHTREGKMRVFPAVPAGWETARFAGIRAEGAFLVSAELEAGQVRRVEVRSEAGAPLRLENPWGDSPVVIRRGAGPPKHARGRFLEIATEAGETLEIVRV